MSTILQSARQDLRHYQQDVLDRVLTAIAAGGRHPLIVAPTGSGKTVMACALIASAMAQGQSVLILVHRHELVTQMSRTLHAAGIDHGIIKAGFPSRPGERVQVASIQTLHARAIRSAAIDLPPADLVVVDEAHHTPARTYRKLLAAYPAAVVIGLTATPCRGDGRGLGNVFDVLVEAIPVRDLIGQGYLVEARIYAPTRPDLTGVEVRRGDYVEAQLANVMNTSTLVGDVISHKLRLAAGKRAIVFATGVAHSRALADGFGEAGVLAAHLDGGTPTEEREAILRRLASGEVEVVCNAAVLTEGFDCPAVECLVLARPTKSLSLYRQMVGRVLRPAPGKDHALILDHAGAVFTHGFPDDPVQWSLSTDHRAENPSHSRRGKARAPSLTTCPECTAVRFEGQPCSSCGWRPRQKANHVAFAEGELGCVDRNRRAQTVQHSPEFKHNFHAQLVWIARERGRKDGWVAITYRERFGAWPPRYLPPPTAPDPATRAWVRSRDIAFAKSKAKAADRSTPATQPTTALGSRPTEHAAWP